MAEHISIYTEDAVKTALLGPEKTPFALLSAFCEPNSSGLDAEISVDEGEIPYLLQYDSRWCFHGYGSSFMGFTACGPTCLSMALIGLTGNTDYTPRLCCGQGRGCGALRPGRRYCLVPLHRGRGGVRPARRGDQRRAERVEPAAGRGQHRRCLHAAGRLHHQRPLYPHLRLKSPGLQGL